MKSVLTSATIILLAAMVLVVQVAGSSPHLHGFLHGQTAEENACGDCGSSGDPCSGDTGPASPDHVCSVVLMDCGIVAADPVIGCKSDVVAIYYVIREVAETFSIGSLLPECARAPPVL